VAQSPYLWNFAAWQDNPTGLKEDMQRAEPQSDPVELLYAFHPGDLQPSFNSSPDDAEQETYQSDSSDEDMSSEKEFAIGDASQLNKQCTKKRQRRPARRFTYDEVGNSGYESCS